MRDQRVYAISRGLNKLTSSTATYLTGTQPAVQLLQKSDVVPQKPYWLQQTLRGQSATFPQGPHWAVALQLLIHPSPHHSGPNPQLK
ncbi:hypothetical protein MAP00_006139 [Monascus purpureus]|nr:hypothetical protein MAP00_006139 [Monascus purpureus]